MNIDKYNGLSICTDCVLYHANGDDPFRCPSCGHNCDDARCDACDCDAARLSVIVARNWPSGVIFEDDRHRHCNRTCPACEGYGTICDDNGDEIGPCINCNGSGAMERCPDDCDGDPDGHFSWFSCDSCGSTLGGDRYQYMAIIPK